MDTPAVNKLLADAPSSGPWWRFGYVWLVIGGPALVVVAGLFTAWIAVSLRDPVLDQGPTAVSAAAGGQRAVLPAELGRNHAAMPALTQGGAGGGARP